MGIIYSIVILLACILGAIVGLGGGVFIRPIFDAIGYHNVLNIAFFSSSAILTMAVVSTVMKVRDGTKIEAKLALLISVGAVVGGMLGDQLLQLLVGRFEYDASVQRIQIIATVIVLVLSLIFTAKNNLRYIIKNRWVCLPLGVLLGTIAAFLGIGGGPINVPILMIFFGLPIKTATGYSIVIIFFSHASRLITMGVTQAGQGEYSLFDAPLLRLLPFIIIAAALGGFLGAYFSKIFSDKVVKKLFIAALLAVMVLNIYNAVVIVLDKLG